MTTKVEPTVEGWDEEAERLSRAIKTLKDRKSAYYFITGWFADLHDDLLSHSVQEAKEEERESLRIAFIDLTMEHGGEKDYAEKEWKHLLGHRRIPLPTLSTKEES